MACDLCGKKGATKKVRIEGTVFDACSTCGAYGSPVKTIMKRGPRQQTVDTTIVASNAGVSIRLAREKRKAQQKDFAQLLGVKESLLQNWESGKVLPTLKQARAIERKLNIGITQQPSSEDFTTTKTTSGSLTIGDLIKKR